MKISECLEKIPLAKSTILEHIKKGNIKAEMVKGAHSEEWSVDESSFNEFCDNYNRKIIEKKKYEQELIDKAKIVAPEMTIKVEKEGKEKDAKPAVKIEQVAPLKPEPAPVQTDTEKLDETERQLLLEKEKYIQLLQERLKAVEEAAAKEAMYLKSQIEYQQKESEYLKSQVEEERTEKRDITEKFHTATERTLMLLANLKKQEQQLVELEKKSIEYQQKDSELNERMQHVVDVSRGIMKEEISQGKIAVLAIDDDPDFLNILQINFGSDNDIALYTADNVYDANKYLVKGIFNVILLDLRLQEDSLSGEQYYTQIKSMMSNLFDTKLIIISGESEERIRTASEQLSAAATLKKPIKIQELKEKLKEIVEDSGLGHAMKQSEHEPTLTREEARKHLEK